MLDSSREHVFPSRCQRSLRVDDELRVRNIEFGVQLRAVGTLNAVVRPKHLLTVGQIDHLEGLGSRMARGEGDVARRMPVLGQDDVLEALAKPLISGTISSPLGTARLPPATKEFCTSITSKTSRSISITGSARSASAHGVALEP